MDNLWFSDSFPACYSCQYGVVHSDIYYFAFQTEIQIKRIHLLKLPLFLILCLYLLKELFEYAVLYLNLRHMKRAGSFVPKEFEGKIDDQLLKKMQDYEADKSYFSIIASLFGNVVAIIFFFGGLLNIYNSYIASLNLSFLVSGWLFFLLLSYGEQIISIPFSLYSTFKIENKYGFNTMTARLWIADFVKSLIISTTLYSFLLFAALFLIQWSPKTWWFWVWSFILLYSLFIMFISPYVIEPLFNKFTPVDDESLRQRIAALVEKVGIHAKRIFKMDASKRSKHTNAYFTGIGRTKRIVLYDTLLQGMNHDEIITVLAHETGHWKKKHILKMMLAVQLFSLIALYVSFQIIQSDFLLRLFNISAPSLFPKFLILGFLAGIISLPLQPIVNWISRKHEWQADRISYELTSDAESMISSLIKLSKETLANLYPHPLYVFLYYSPPPMLERVGYIREFRRV